MEIINEITIPDNVKELEQATEYIETLKFKYKQAEEFKKLSAKEFTKLYSDTLKILYHVGELSIPLFNVADDLEDAFFIMYKSTPKLAKVLWLQKYREIHKPYNLLKNRCFTILDNLEELYLQIHKKYPKLIVEEF